MQCVWLFGLGQEKIDAEQVLQNLKDTKAWQARYPFTASTCIFSSLKSRFRLNASKALSEEEQKTFRLRIEKPYPTDVRNHN